MDYELDPKLKFILLILSIVLICALIVGINSIINYQPPKQIQPIPKHSYNVTIHTGTVKHYTLRIESNFSINSYTITQSNYSILLKEGRYQIEACFYSNNYPQCESRYLNVYDDITINLFGGI